MLCLRPQPHPAGPGRDAELHGPLFTTVLAAIFLGETLRAPAIGGLALIGVWLIVDPQGGQCNVGTVVGLCSVVVGALIDGV
ncbi:MAG: hypothetical protein H7338_23210 [Candidatus Sericytochromatia bacterium]|nr:hypothetical protein [Candidatus Sericytochromatia bacterium]